MLSRLFNESLPSPTEEQLQTILNDREIGLSSEITSVAFEPRFKLYALGSATGDFHIINNKNYWYKYIPITTEPPILKIIPLPNSSTFLSLCSATLYENHPLNIPRQQRPMQTNNIFFKPQTILSEVKASKFYSYITHWIVMHDGNILHRPIQLKYDIIDFAASPIHPEFVLLLSKTGSIYGFSVEEMKFTELYINYFEGKNVHSIICPYALKFFISHDIIEKLNMTNKEISAVQQVGAAQFDIFRKSDTVALIDSKQKKPSLFKSSRQESTVELLSGSVGTCVSLMNEREWASVVHSKDGDSVYSGNQLRIHLKGELLIPAIVPRYKKPLAKDELKSVTFFTNYGRVINLNGNSMDHFMLRPIEPRFAFIDKSDNIYVFSDKNECFIFEKNNFVGSYKFDWAKPLAVLNGFALCLSDTNEPFIANIKTNQKVQITSPLVPSTVVTVQIFEGYIDFLCESGKVIRFDLLSNDKFEGFEVVDIEELKVCYNYPYHLSNNPWRPFNGTFACIKQINQLSVLIADKFIFHEVCQSNECVVFFEVIDSAGKVNPKDSSFIVIVTSFHISIFAVDEKGLKRVRHVSLGNDRVIEASVTSWGVLIVRTETRVQLLVLPDVSYDPIAKLSLTYEAPPPLVDEIEEAPDNGNSNSHAVEAVKSINPIILPHKGLIVFERNLVTIFLKEILIPDCFDEKKLPNVLIPPPESGIKKIFGKKGGISVEEADRCFLFNRPQKQKNEQNADNDDNAAATAASIGSSLSETQELMQQILAKANERGEQLNELEIKAQKLAQSAKEYRNACRKFRH